MDKQTKNERYYNPQEHPPRFPLELTPYLHICLWSKDGEYKWTIAYWILGKEGYDLQFVGDRPLDERVDWEHLRQCISKGRC